jgi:hypothetical protein
MESVNAIKAEVALTVFMNIYQGVVVFDGDSMVGYSDTGNPGVDYFLAIQQAREVFYNSFSHEEGFDDFFLGEGYYRLPCEDERGKYRLYVPPMVEDEDQMEAWVNGYLTSYAISQIALQPTDN